MSGALNIAGEVAVVASVLAGLILVYLGTALGGFDGYAAEGKGLVTWAYRRRAYPAFLGFVAAILSCGFALHAKAAAQAEPAETAVWFLTFAGLSILVSAALALRDRGY